MKQSMGQGTGWEVRACPFCAGTDVEVCRTNENACWLRCEMCGIDGPTHATLRDAVRAWDSRPPQKEAATVTRNDDTRYWADEAIFNQPNEKGQS